MKSLLFAWSCDKGGRGLFVLSYFTGFFFSFQFIKSLFEAVAFFFCPFSVMAFYEFWRSATARYCRQFRALHASFFVLGRLALALLDRAALFHFQANRLRLAALSCGADVDHHPFTTICEPFLRRGGRGFCGVRSPVWTHFNCFYALGGLLYLIRRPCIMFGSAIILSPPSS